VPSATLVTGGSGVVGRALVERLVAGGREVVALVRSEEAARTVAARGARPVPGDVLDPESLRRAAADCETCFHVAGVNELCSRDPARMYRVNILGTLNVVSAAARAGLRRVVVTSSATTLGEGPGTVGDEFTPHRGWYLSHYERSKHEAERTAFSAAAEGVEVVCVNPSSVQGPGRSGGTTRLLRAALDGRLRFVVETTVSLVDVRDCAEGHVLAESRGAAGERYVLSAGTVTTRRALELVASIAGVDTRARTLSPAAARTAAGVVEGAARLARRAPPLCREMVRTIVAGHAYDGSRAERELGLRYRSVEETLRGAIEWLRREGLVTS
jgi:dihydroflavonol-4-reductase